ncbi:hypothetical protein FHW83_004709 [Duganella sp. SG902]|uniref:hypothetical protein n=1 Tax=Duganella sp. SG902 TaxID=2587016 RepID=UPI00159DF451|nr:hypothetical protein [Duganella sp. SG902]NVM78878.1 hypothetical protein [Duganella sp. SG902]
MNNYLEKIFDLLRKRPGLSAVQLSDLLDIDLEVVENTLVMALRDQRLSFVETPGGNGLTLKKYSLPIKTLGWDAPPANTQTQIDVPVKRREATGAAIVASTTPVDSRSKVQMAIDHLEKHGPSTRDTLKVAMGLTQRYAVPQLLKSAIKSGKIVFNDDIYSIGIKESAPTAPRRQSAAATASKPDKTLVASHTEATPSASDDDALTIGLLRGRLRPNEFIGYLKGRALELLLDADRSGRADDYKRAGHYTALIVAECATAPANNSI